MMWISMWLCQYLQPEMSFHMEKTSKMRNLVSKIMLTELYTKNPQRIHTKNVYNTVDSVDKSLTKQLFADGDDISRPHSYQQIAVCTIFQ